MQLLPAHHHESHLLQLLPGASSGFVGILRSRSRSQERSPPSAVSGELDVAQRVDDDSSASFRVTRRKPNGASVRGHAGESLRIREECGICANLVLRNLARKPRSHGGEVRLDRRSWDRADQEVIQIRKSTRRPRRRRLEQKPHFLHLNGMSLELSTRGGGLERRRGEPTKEVDLTVTIVVSDFVHSPSAQRAAVRNPPFEESIDVASVGQ